MSDITHINRHTYDIVNVYIKKATLNHIPLEIIYLTISFVGDLVAQLSICCAMRTCHLFGKILKEHFDSNICELFVKNSFDYRSYSLHILDNLLLIGDMPRDILLQTTVKNIQCALNLRELTKIQLNHLRKYHDRTSLQSPNNSIIRCAYWQHYLNKFDSENELSEQNDMIKFHNNSYIFNAKYMIDVISQSKYFKTKVCIDDIPQHGTISCTIIDDIQHENYNLIGQTFEFKDTLDSNKILRYKQELLANPFQIFKRSRWKSICLFPPIMTNLFDPKEMPINIEIYTSKLRDKISCQDFSINTTLIPLSSITEFCGTGDSTNLASAACFWEYIIENGLDGIDAIRDIKINRVLKVPHPGTDLQIIKMYPPTYHFWRTIELIIKLPNFCIDESLINAHIKHYNKWLHVMYFKNDKNRNKQDVQAILNVLETLQFKKRFIEILSEIFEMNSDLMSIVPSKYHGTLVDYGYLITT